VQKFMATFFFDSGEERRIGRHECDAQRFPRGSAQTHADKARGVSKSRTNT